jgi:hypothetical protein
VPGPRPGEGLRRGAAAVSVVAVGLVGLQIGYGADPGAALLYLGYQVCFLLIPGWLAYRALTSRAGEPIRQLAIGWALGYVVELLAFMLTAATGARGILVAYPVVVAAIAIALIRHRREPFRWNLEPPQSSRFTWLLVAVCLAGAAYVGLTFFPSTPLPGEEAVQYFPDHSWAISIAAEAKHHWPIEDPSVSGEAFPYHYFVHIHLAAASQVTGIELPLLYFRLSILPVIVLLVLALVSAAQSLLRHPQAGLIAAALALLIGQAQMDLTESIDARLAFLGVFFTYLTASPSFLFGLIMFVPLLTLIGERLIGRESPAQIGDWALILLFTVGASGSKVVILPLVIGGLALFMGWSAIAHRRVPLAAVCSLALTVLVLGVLYLLQYRGESSGLELGPGFDFFYEMPAVEQIRLGLAEVLPGFPGRDDLLSVVGIPLGALGLLAPGLIGAIWLFRRQGLRLEAAQAWLLALFMTGLAAALTLTSVPGNEYFFLFTALTASFLLAGEGLWIAWESRPAPPAPGGRVAALVVAWLIVVAVIMLAPRALDLFTGTNSDAYTYLFWYGGLLLSLLALYAAARTWLGPQRWIAAALLCGGVILVGAVDIPAQNIRPALAAPKPAQGDVMSPELYRALTWIRDHTSPDSVIAVNDQQADIGPYEFDFGAFSERRVFLAGWGFSGDRSERAPLQAGAGTNIPYPERLALNQAAFERADPAALGALQAQYGVRYLVVDEVNGSEVDLAALEGAAVPVYQGDGVTVFELA